MRWNNLVPEFAKPVLRPIYYSLITSGIYRRIKHRPQSRDELHRYWEAPYDSDNLHQDYFKGEIRSQFLVKILERKAEVNARVLEIGSNVGRNLYYLYLAGFRKLSGIELSEKAIALLKEAYPEMASHATIYNKPVEEAIKTFSDCEFDVVFTMAVLEHIHTDSEWVFPEIARITNHCLITIEDEYCLSWRHFPRNYKNVFEPLGMKQIEEMNCRDVEGLGSAYIARIFINKAWNLEKT